MSGAGMTLRVFCGTSGIAAPVFQRAYAVYSSYGLFMNIAVQPYHHSAADRP